MGTVSLPVLAKKSFPVRAPEVGPRGPADDGRPSLSAPCRLGGPGVLRPRHLLASPGPVSPPLRSTHVEILLPSRRTCFLFCSTLSGSPGATSRRPSLLIALVSWKESHASLLCSPRRLSSPHPSGDRLAPRRPRSVKTVVPCRRNDLPTTAGGWGWGWGVGLVDVDDPWKAGTGESSCGHPLGHHRVRGRERSGRRRGRRRIP